MISEFIERLRQRLQEPLPGPSAQQQMMPTLSTGKGIRFPPKQHPRKGAVMILLYEDQDQLHFPLILRPVYAGVHSGQVALPGGKYEPEDIDLVTTALRESEEEIGVPANEVEVIGTLSEYYIGASNYEVLPVVGLLHSLPRFIPDPREVQEVISSPLPFIWDDQLKKEKALTSAAGFELNCPYFDIYGHVVWGATAMMLNEFSEVTKHL